MNCKQSSKEYSVLAAGRKYLRELPVSC